MNNEAHFGKSRKKQGRAGIYYSTDPETVPVHVKKMPKAKFEQRVLVWLAISPEGASEPFFLDMKMAMDAENYTKILKKNLLPFIAKMKRRAKGKKPNFWRDLASSHCADETKKFYNDHKISYISQSTNPPALPQVRPIERVWARLKDDLNKELTQKGDMTFDEIKIRISQLIKSYGKAYYTRLFDGLYQKCRLAAEQGPEYL